MRRGRPRAALRFLIGAMVLGFSACSEADAPTGGVPVYAYEVVNVYPRDAEAWTQGLAFHDGFLYESTGLYGRSSVRRVRLETGEVLRELAAHVARGWARRVFNPGGSIVGRFNIELRRYPDEV